MIRRIKFLRCSRCSEGGSLPLRADQNGRTRADGLPRYCQRLLPYFPRPTLSLSCGCHGWGPAPAVALLGTAPTRSPLHQARLNLPLPGCHHIHTPACPLPYSCPLPLQPPYSTPMTGPKFLTQCHLSISSFQGGP